MLFDGPSELPIATLRPSVHDRRGTVVLGLERWLSNLGAWLRPRAVPLLVAFASLLVMLGALETITIWPPGERIHVVAGGPLMRAPGVEASSGTGAVIQPPCHAIREPVRFLLRPLAPGEHATVLTLVALDPP